MLAVVRPLVATSALLSSLAIAATVAACGDDAGPGDELLVPAHCNPLATEAACVMPWPSGAYVVADATTTTGRKLLIPTEALPTNIDGISLDPTPWNRWDGFSPVGPILARFPGGVSATGLPPLTDPDASLAATSPIILMNVATGERAPFFAEVDMNIVDPAERTLIIRPLNRLTPGAVYGVAIRSAVKNATGGALPISAGFAAALAGETIEHPRWAAATADLPAFLTQLDSAGVARTDLVMAWTFPTASDQFLQRDLTHMRDAAMTAMGTDGANLAVTMTELPPRGTLRRYVGTFTSPSFVTAGRDPASIIRRGAGDLPELSGTWDAAFAAVVPSCVNTMPLPRPTIIFGHGIFGSGEDYLDNSLVEQVAEDYCFIMLAGDFIGLTMTDLPLAPLAANDLNKVPRISEKLAQSVIDFIAMTQLSRGPLQTAPEFRVGANPIIDRTRTYFLGGSLGGTMGGTIMAYEPTITRGIFAVPGGNWSMLFERSTAWEILQPAAQGAYPEPEDAQMIVSLFGMQMELIDPITAGRHVLRDPLPGSPVKTILMWQAIGDSLVNNVATEMTAREFGIPVLGPSVKAPWRLDIVTGPQPSAFSIYDEHRTPLPTGFNTPEDDNGTHSGVNDRPAILRSIEHFVNTGEAINTCVVGGNAAPCDCATGACD
ncbi:MAG: hypothetical protein KBG28_10485 [Kofleriaceae bacterium]|jgi:hypothetical protein|nr:hypothetical protein [Kofleriaceae bacterium]